MSKNANDNDVTKMTFEDIAAKYGEEAAINAGIVADPEAFELDEGWFKRARPAREMAPHICHLFIGDKRRENWIAACRSTAPILQRP